MDKRSFAMLFGLALAVLVVVVGLSFVAVVGWPSSGSNDDINFGAFIEAVERGDVADIADAGAFSERSDSAVRELETTTLSHPFVMMNS